MLFIEDSSSDQLGHSVNNISDQRVFDKQLLFDYHRVLFMKMNLKKHTLTINE